MTLLLVMVAHEAEHIISVAERAEAMLSVYLKRLLSGKPVFLDFPHVRAWKYHPDLLLAHLRTFRFKL